jgi:hypothetical protein
MFEMRMTPLTEMVQRQRRRWRSPFLASCLPKSEALLRRHPDLISAIDRVESIDEYESVMDAAVACFLPEIRPAMAAFYKGKGRPLREFPAAAVAKHDARLAALVKELHKLDESTAVAAILVLRKG